MTESISTCQLINNHIEQLLQSIKGDHVREYDWLVQNVHHVAWAEYQRRYRIFWRLHGAGLSQHYCRVYFWHLQAGLANGPPQLAILVKQLYQTPVNKSKQALQFSFCTKLCHMLDRQIPIYDSRIRGFYSFAEPNRKLPVDERIEAYLQFHQFLGKEYKRVLNEGLLAPSIEAFRKHFKPQHFTDIKVIDSLIWAFVSSK